MRPVRLTRHAALGLLAALAASGAASQPTFQSTLTMALTGDSIITRRLSVYQEPEYLKMIELLRGADLAFTNLEMLFHDYQTYAMSESGGTYMRADPALAKELVWAGFDLVSRANNHTGDYGVLGMQLTSRFVRDAGLVQSGVGESLEEAREAAFLETAGGRVALISVASTFPDFSRAGKTRGGTPPRPGLNPLRFSTTNLVTRERLEMLRDLLKELGLNAPPSGDSLTAFRQRFVVGDKPEVRTEPNTEDLEEIGAVVKNASRLADYVIVTIHAHEGDRNLFLPAQFLVTFARAMLDAGADVFVGHGPHVLRAIEIYKGKPIFYSLGDFIFQNETLDRLPSENYEPFGLGPSAHVADWNDQRYDFDRRGFPAQREIWESVVARPVWRGKTLAELKLHPITLGFGKPRTVRGRPMLAEPELAKKIIEDLARLSQPFGTRIEFQDGIGVVRLAGAPTN